MFSHFKIKNYHKAVFALLCMMILSTLNDVISKFIGQRLNSLEVIFFRFFFALITLIPFALYKGREVFHTSQPKFNIFRGILGTLSFYFYIYSIVKLPLVEVVTIFWTIPLFVLVLSKIFLHETITSLRLGATIFGFVGLVFITSYDNDTNFSLKFIYIFPVLSSLLFASQDVMIKKIISKDSKLTTLLYFAITTTLLTALPAYFVWISPTLRELFLLSLLGISANLMQICLFKAFSYAELSALAPYRYLEFVFSAVAGFIFFCEIPESNVIIGALILIPSTLYLAYTEYRKQNKKVKI